ncbi:MAG: hypothetical protein WKF75_04205, partial [Singulisphaera sp.]
MADTHPPCRSTRLCTSASPIPSPLRPIRGRVRLGEEIEDPGQDFRSDPDAVVPHPDDQEIGLAHGLQGDPAPRLGVLGGVGQEVAQDLDEPDRVGLQPERLGRERHRELVAARIDERPGGLDGAGHLRRHLDRDLAERDVAAPDARGVEEVVDEPGHLPPLPQDHPSRLGQVPAVALLVAEGPRLPQDRG